MDTGDGPGSGRQIVAAVLALAALLAVGLWVTNTLRGTAGIQDCVAAGRSNCTPIR